MLTDLPLISVYDVYFLIETNLRIRLAPYVVKCYTNHSETDTCNNTNNL